MKKFLKSAGMPILVFGLAIGGALATNAMKNVQATELGYQKLDNDGLECSIPRNMCSSEFNEELCTWTVGTTTHTLYGKQNDPILGTVCTKTLYKINP